MIAIIVGLTYVMVTSLVVAVLFGAAIYILLNDGGAYERWLTGHPRPSVLPSGNAP